MTDSLFQSAFAISPPSYLTATPLSWHMQPLEKIYARVKLCTRNTCAGLWHALWQISVLAPDIHTTENKHMKCGMQTHKSTCSNLLSSLCHLIARQQHKLITAEREPIVLTKPTFIKVQQPHSQQTEMSSLSWIMSWQTHTLLVQFSKSAGMD